MRFVGALATVVLAAEAAAARGPARLPLFPNPLIDVQGCPAFIATGDFNADGTPDLVAADSHFYGCSAGQTADASVLLGRGDGTFVLRQRLGERFANPGPFPWGNIVTVADFDSDGVQDLAVAMGGVAIYLGRGDGTFAEGRPLLPDDPAVAVVAGDFNTDSRIDLALANAFSGEVQLLMGRGDGTFLQGGRFGVGEQPVSIAVGRFNADPNPDLVVANTGNWKDNPGHISILLGRGDGTFVPESRQDVGEAPVDVRVADFDTDGKSDLAVGNLSSANITVLLGNGDGTFKPQASLDRANSVTGLDQGDFDLDGKIDLVITRLRSSALLFRGRGDGTFELGVDFDLGSSAFSIVAEDFNADGFIDVAAPLSKGYVSVLTGKGDGTFWTQESIYTGKPSSAVAVSDFNLDQRVDFVVVSVRGPSSFGEAQIFLGADDVGFAPLYPYLLDGGDFRDSQIAIGDFSLEPLFSKDGFPDIAVSGYPARVVFGPSLGWLPELSIGEGDAIAAADFDEDGSLDVAVGQTDRDELEVILFTTNLSGDPPTVFRVEPLAVGDQPRAIAVGDFNRDRHSDLAVAHGVSKGVWVFLGQGNGTFSLAPQLPTEEAVSLLAADLNSDGIDDLAVSQAVASFTDGRVSVFLSEGTGRFGAELSTAVGWKNLGPLAAGDIDGDGRLDLAMAHRAEPFLGEGVSVLLGAGDGTFHSHLLFRAGMIPAGLALGDLNSDGSLDLLVANRGDRPDFLSDGSVSILLNRGAPPNVAPTAVARPEGKTECTSPAGAAVALDGSASGDPDSMPGSHDDIVLFEWFLDFGLPTQMKLGVGEMLSSELGVGSHSVTLRVVDSQGASDTDTIVILVVDSTPPVLTISLAPSILWPPNHRMVDVKAEVSALDVCSTPSLILGSIHSSELDDAEGTGDGATVGDIRGAEVGVADFLFQLRSERAGAGQDRTYSVTYVASDSAGNSVSATSMVSVLHDRRGSTEPILIRAYENHLGTLLEWSTVPLARSYNAVRGELHILQEGDGVFDMGPLLCIAAATTSTNTEGREDPERPPPGRAFFYLVEYDDGRLSSFGTESAPRERIAQPGVCR